MHYSCFGVRLDRDQDDSMLELAILPEAAVPCVEEISTMGRWAALAVALCAAAGAVVAVATNFEK